MSPEPSTPAVPRRQLTLFDSTSIIVGIIIGAGIYESTPLIASHVPNLGGLLLAWFLGGLFSLVGALCYAELATTYPGAGGDYVYLTRAVGRPMGVLFAWARLWVVRPGSIGAMAFIFARYANQLLPLSTVLGGQTQAMLTYAVGSIAHAQRSQRFWGARGKVDQNVLSTAKVLGLLGVVAVGFVFSNPPLPRPQPRRPAKQLTAGTTCLAALGSP